MTVCADWITNTDMEACYTIPDGFDTTSILTQASEIAYTLSGRQFPGVCTETVTAMRRPLQQFESAGVGRLPVPPLPGLRVLVQRLVRLPLGVMRMRRLPEP